jgi:hypothetical protein
MNSVRSVWRWVVLAFAVLSAGAAETSPADAVVTMEPVKVNGGYFDFRITFARETNRLKVFQITWVAPKLEKSGLRVGDRITMIDGIKIEGLLLDEVRKLLKPPAPGAQTVFTGSGKRGLFARKADVTITLTGNPPQDAAAAKFPK